MEDNELLNSDRCLGFIGSCEVLLTEAELSKADRHAAISVILSCALTMLRLEYNGTIMGRDKALDLYAASVEKHLERLERMN